MVTRRKGKERKDPAGIVPLLTSFHKPSIYIVTTTTCNKKEEWKSNFLMALFPHIQ
jgi:hypothetical protein